MYAWLRIWARCIKGYTYPWWATEGLGVWSIFWWHRNMIWSSRDDVLPVVRTIGVMCCESRWLDGSVAWRPINPARSHWRWLLPARFYQWSWTCKLYYKWMDWPLVEPRTGLDYGQLGRDAVSCNGRMRDAKPWRCVCHLLWLIVNYGEPRLDLFRIDLINVHI